VADFGIARANDGSRLTATGALLGTATYLSPEQVQGRPLTPARDIFSLGVVAYQCLAGQPPFVAEGEIATALARLQQSAPPLPAEVPTAVAYLVAEMLTENPDLRPTAEIISRTARRITASGSAADPITCGPARSDPVSESHAGPTVVMPTAELEGRPHRLLSAGQAHRGFRRRHVVLATIACLLVLAGGLILAGAFGHSGTKKGLAGRRPDVAASSATAAPKVIAPVTPTVLNKHSSKGPAALGPAAHGPGHIPPVHANGHGPKKHKPGHGHGPGPGPGVGKNRPR
jgi:hypothetical protein